MSIWEKRRKEKRRKKSKKVNKNPAIMEWVGSEDKARFLITYI